MMMSWIMTRATRFLTRKDLWRPNFSQEGPRPPPPGFTNIHPRTHPQQSSPPAIKPEADADTKQSDDKGVRSYWSAGCCSTIVAAFGRVGECENPRFPENSNGIRLKSRIICVHIAANLFFCRFTCTQLSMTGFICPPSEGWVMPSGPRACGGESKHPLRIAQCSKHMLCGLTGKRYPSPEYQGTRFSSNTSNMCACNEAGRGTAMI